jgi:hypothetical protein
MEEHFNEHMNIHLAVHKNITTVNVLSLGLCKLNEGREEPDVQIAEAVCMGRHLNRGRITLCRCLFVVDKFCTKNVVFIQLYVKKSPCMNAQLKW